MIYRWGPCSCISLAHSFNKYWMCTLCQMVYDSKFVWWWEWCRRKQTKSVCRREREEFLAQRAGQIPQIFAWPICSAPSDLWPHVPFLGRPFLTILSQLQLLTPSQETSLFISFFLRFFLYRHYHFLVPNTLFILSLICLLSWENKLYKTRDHQYLEQHLIGWCKSNCGFCIVEICHLILEYILYKFGYDIHHFNMNFSLCFFFANDLLLAFYFIFILDYGNVGQKANSSNFLIWVQNGL